MTVMEPPDAGYGVAPPPRGLPQKLGAARRFWGPRAPPSTGGALLRRPTGEGGAARRFR
jgi:hypothetical protein